VFSFSKIELTPPVAILLSGVLVAGAILFTHYYAPGDGAALAGFEPEEEPVAVRAPGDDDHWYGQQDAPIVVVEYSDFQCPYCAVFHPTVKRIVDESQGEVAWVYRHFPLESIHPEARPSAVAAECVAAQLGQSGFWAFADAAFTNQRSLSSTYYAQLAGQLGADTARFNACVASGEYETRVDADYSEALVNGAQGTPFTVILTAEGQVPLSGALPYAQVKAVITALMSRQ
jgi:protein-disulfide isomerase